MRKAKNRGLAGRSLPLPWTPFEEAPLPPPELLAATGNPSRIFVNSLYQVHWHDAVDSSLGPIVWLSIKRRDLAPVRDWRDMQRIKNELAGPEAEAVELYPAESRVVDMSNQYHLWVLPGGRFPFGFQSRAVTEEALPGGAQRPWPPETRPADLMTDTLSRALEFHGGQLELDMSGGQPRLRPAREQR